MGEYNVPAVVRPVPFLRNQQYQEIKEECISHGVLFEDCYFPAENISLFYSEAVNGRIEMKRPHQIVGGLNNTLATNPQFFVSGVSRFDANQGKLGNCWFVASVVSLTLNENVFHSVVPKDNTFEPGRYCGAFHFRFWHNNSLVDVVIDDRLPTINGQLIYMKPTGDEWNEFWGALLEKAYAKLHGSYQNLAGGWAKKAFENFTGGANEFYLANSCPPNIFDVMSNAANCGSFLNCSTPQMTDHQRLKTGICGSHEYSITGLCIIPTSGIRLLRVRNPWGCCEWKGAWSDKSPEWNSVSDELKKEIGLSIRNDGEFWISLEDFSRFFYALEICHCRAVIIVG